MEKQTNFNEFYKRNMNCKPSLTLKRFFANNYKQNLKGNIAIDLGCGTGNDTELLLKNGFKVIAIDNQNQVKEILINKNLDSSNLEIIIDDFSKIKLPKADLINANFSLFFVKENFNIFIENMLKNINMEGYFIGNFLGKEDEWEGIRTTVEKEEVLDFFKGFKMLYFSEEKYYKDSVSRKNKFWHVYTIIAQKEEK